MLNIREPGAQRVPEVISSVEELEVQPEHLGQHCGLLTRVGIPRKGAISSVSCMDVALIDILLQRGVTGITSCISESYAVALVSPFVTGKDRIAQAIDTVHKQEHTV